MFLSNLSPIPQTERTESILNSHFKQRTFILIAFGLNSSHNRLLDSQRFSETFLPSIISGSSRHLADSSFPLPPRSLLSSLWNIFCYFFRPPPLPSQNQLLRLRMFKRAQSECCYSKTNRWRRFHRSREKAMVSEVLVFARDFSKLETV